ncbi:ImmA/IrrE family metallo-endopeptidase [Acinetobacter baumannii]|uniref:ImmA/IrrE family metallo-endopeptidase n=1 Tax=Acinetobacter baumannii TaxID=470 RepID=UPI000F74B762|nr:ImmA/IrrE family metallo-endopeptidase [Acinetobacter baumannii]RSQ72095.1 ImmA/IrrE family metallo-endopeptidase [Acinetobacter baumannii]
MILNSFELQLTEGKINKLEAAIQELQKETDQNSIFKKIELDSMNVFLEDLKNQYTEYLEIAQKYKDKTISDEVALKEPQKLVYIRIANNITQEEIANLLSWEIEEVKRQEDSLYKNLNNNTLLKINKFLVEKIDSQLLNSEFEINWNLFPIKEMIKRKWLNDLQNPIEEFKNKFTQIFQSNNFEPALHRKFQFNGKSANEYSLLAWQITVLTKAKELVCEHSIPSFTPDTSWLKDLIQLSVHDDGPLQAQEFLKTKGILLIIEPHFTSTYLDGAAMLLPESNIPVIGMTLRKNRIDNFWFVLFHELGHIFLHLNKDLTAIIDEEVDKPHTAILEHEADIFALNHQIHPAEWDLCASRFYMEPNHLIEDAQRLKVHPGILAGRIRNDTGNYHIFSEFVGHNSVKKLFMEDTDDNS